MEVSNSEKTFGIKVVSIILFIYSLPMILMAFFAMISGPPPTAAEDVLVRFLFVISPPVFIASGIGLLKRMRWALYLTLLICVGMLAWLFYMFSDPQSDKDVFSIILATAFIPFFCIFFYMIRSAVRSKFK